MTVPPTVFHFNCSFCGAHPKAVLLTDFAHRWRTSPQSDFDAVLCAYSDIVSLLRDSTARWLTKKFLATLPCFGKPLGELLSHQGAIGTANRGDCPLCLTPVGHRPDDKYFTHWPQACCVQTANFFYEAGIVFFSVARSLPRWAQPSMLGTLGRLLRANHRALNAVGLMECPRCGRHTTSLYGDGSVSNPHRCRWCLDCEPPLVITLGVTRQGTIRPHDDEQTTQNPRLLLDDIIPFRETATDIET